MAPQSVLKLEPVYNCRSLVWWGGQIPLRKDSSLLQRICTTNLPPSLPQRNLWPWTRVPVHWRKGNNLTLRGLLDIGSDLTLIPVDPMSLWTSSQSRSLCVMWSRNFSSGLPHSGLSGCLDPSCGYSSVLECIIGTDVLNSWRDSYIGSLTCGVKAIIMWKAKWSHYNCLYLGK